MSTQEDTYRTVVLDYEVKKLIGLLLQSSPDVIANAYQSVGAAGQGAPPMVQQLFLHVLGSMNYALQVALHNQPQQAPHSPSVETPAVPVTEAPGIVQNGQSPA